MPSRRAWPSIRISSGKPKPSSPAWRAALRGARATPAKRRYAGAMAQLSDDCFAFGGPMLSVEDAVALLASRLGVVAGSEAIVLGQADWRVLARCAPRE